MRGEQRVGLREGDPEDRIATTLVPLMHNHPSSTGPPEGALTNKSHHTLPLLKCSAPQGFSLPSEENPALTSASGPTLES